jgi:hypothetical protein
MTTPTAHAKTSGPKGSLLLADHILLVASQAVAMLEQPTFNKTRKESEVPKKILFFLEPKHYTSSGNLLLCISTDRSY